jgi:hypothetical protein
VKAFTPLSSPFDAGLAAAAATIAESGMVRPGAMSVSRA